MRRGFGGEVLLSVNITTSEASRKLLGGNLNPGDNDAGPGAPVYHLPVMTVEVVRGLEVSRNGVYLDGTLGEGGHSLAILEAGYTVGNPEREEGDSRPEAPAGEGLVIGIDLDGRSAAAASQRLAGFGARFLALQGNYADMVSLSAQNGVGQVDGVLLDLGFSSRQVGRPGYGLSFQSDEPLDMRYDADQDLDAAGVVNNSSERELTDLFRRYGEEPRAAAIARAIVRERVGSPIESTAGLAALVERTSGRRPGHRLHPATRVFQALRIAVNGELENLRAGLEAAVALLRPGGRLAVISYHSLEDRIVKNFMTHESAVCVCPPGLPVCVCGQTPTLAIVNRRIIRPTGEEVAFNPRSRSARLRLARRIDTRNELE